MEFRHREVTAICTSRWCSLGERVANLKDGESIVVEPDGDPTEQARKIRNGLNGVRNCRSVRRTVKIVGGKIVITRVGIWPMLSAFLR